MKPLGFGRLESQSLLEARHCLCEAGRSAQRSEMKGRPRARAGALEVPVHALTLGCVLCVRDGPQDVL